MIKEIQCTFSMGRDAWSETELRVMLRNSRDVLGPSVFSRERGTPSSLKAEIRVLRLCEGREEDGVTVRKSSRR